MVVLVCICLIIIVSQIYRYLKLFKYPKTCKNKTKKDCVIICGYPADDDGRISEVLKSRVDEGIALYKDGLVKTMIMSGTAAHNQYVEAIVMKDYAILQGVKSEDILLETKAKSTYHNMLYSKDIVEEKGIKTCYVITNSWHLRKADYYSRKFGFDYEMISSRKPESMSYLKVIYLHIHMHITTYINLLKGYS